MLLAAEIAEGALSDIFDSADIDSGGRDRPARGHSPRPKGVGAAAEVAAKLSGAAKVRMADDPLYAGFAS
jgi:hypothetical protein